MGVEILGGEPEAGLAEAKETLIGLMEALGVDYTFSDSVRRGLTDYTSPGFEVECDGLGAHRQIAGGGPYAEGVGWAIGVDRLLLALDLHPIVSRGGGRWPP